MKRRIARGVGTGLRGYPGGMTAQDYVSAFYRKYRDLPDALKAYRAEKTSRKSVSAYRTYAADKLLDADAKPTRESEHDPELLLPVVLNRLRRSMPVSRGRTSSKGVVAQEIEGVLEDLVAIYRFSRTFFKEEGRWSSHFGGAILLEKCRTTPGERGRLRILKLIARRWGRDPFRFNCSLKKRLEGATVKSRDVVDRLLRTFDGSRSGFVEGRRPGSKDSKPRATSGRVAARNLEVDAEALEIRRKDPDRGGWGDYAEAIRKIAARRKLKVDSVKKGLLREK